MQLLAGVPYFRTWVAQPQAAFHRGWKIAEVRAVSRSFLPLRASGYLSNVRFAELSALSSAFGLKNPAPLRSWLGPLSLRRAFPRVQEFHGSASNSSGTSSRGVRIWVWVQAAPVGGKVDAWPLPTLNAFGAGKDLRSKIPNLPSRKWPPASL